MSKSGSKPRFVSYEKLSKREKRKLDASKRVTWEGISPITRAPERSDAYNRQKENRRIAKALYQRSGDCGGFVIFAV
ncbi:MAG: hypothetical protein PHI27_08890 [Eubacteriales bacterium]|nr:hypothetical protein [Eubacteriales bacterium]MDD3882356.1 hypothetical protein [Eubacteriales bacterium]MDD4512423.1 hypothetical protein [Eubacteriales bacterium]